MRFNVAFHDLGVLDRLAERCITGHFPHLRLVSLLPADATSPAVRALPVHLQDRIVLDPPALLVGTGLHGVLSLNRTETGHILPTVPADAIFTWDGLPAAYDRWLNGIYLPHNATTSLYSPEGLYPRQWAAGPIALEVVGSCEAYFMEQQVQTVANQLGLQIRSFHTLHNHPTAPIAPAGRPKASVRLVVPPLHFMHPDTLDDFVVHPDHTRLFEETRAHTLAYLDSTLQGSDSVPHFVAGFIEPCVNPEGAFFHGRQLSNFKYFVRCLNDTIVEWCASRPETWFIDANEAASAVGKLYVDEGPIAHFAHRIAFDPYDDWIERECPIATIPVIRSFDIRSAQFYVAIVREVCQRSTILSGLGRVKVVIVDLDNTLWRGLASDQAIGSWNGRPQAIVEALKILKRRGILLAVASKNDEEYVRDHWERILHHYAEVPLGCSLSLDDFDVVKVDFRPKAVTVGEILAELNVLPGGAVFIDDNPREREEVQAAFPDMRVLGAELNYLRRELLYSPFTQSHIRTTEDGVRSATVKTHAVLERHREAGTAQDFLSGLGLSCEVAEVTDPQSIAALRTVQLVNKTNQWNLNGRRIEEQQVSRALAAGHHLLIVHTQDATNEYGLVAAALVDGEQRLVTHMVVSCRVIGMGIDEVLAHRMIERFGMLTFDFADSGRNRAARAFLETNADLGCAGLPDGPVTVTAVTAPSHIRVTVDAEVAGSSV